LLYISGKVIEATASFIQSVVLEDLRVIRRLLGKGTAAWMWRVKTERQIIIFGPS
jgi:hypothetical protein